jgi:hypothetical protein
MENNRYRLKEDKIIGKVKIANKGDIVTVLSTSEGNDGIVCTVSREKDDNRFSVLAKQLTPCN